jgi:general secretion pathway protein A
VYTSFYNLDKKPFQISSDPAFMWFGEKHREALATLEYGILDNKGFLLLTGDVGTGKTTLINILLQRLGDDVICTTVPDPGLEKMDFFNYIAAGFGIEKEFQAKGMFLAYFKKFLLHASDNGKKVLLIIDEAQLLTQEMLEEIRLLSNIEKCDAKLINIFFVGQNEFNEILSRDQNRAVRQRLTLNYNIDPLTPDETADYIKYRLEVAGASHTIFEEAATREVFVYSGGFPRRINVLCDHCLLSGYVKEQKIIDRTIVGECAKELQIPAYVQHRDINDFSNVSEKDRHSQNLEKSPVAEKKPRKKKLLPGVGIVFFLLVVFVSGFYLFPDTYGSAVYFVKKRIVALTHSTIGLMPEKYAAFFPAGDSPEVKPEKNLQPDNGPSRTFEIPKANAPAKVMSSEQASAIVQENIAPQQDMISASAETPELLTALETPIQEELSSNVNKIPPLPEEKVVVRFKYNTNDFTDEGYAELAAYADILALYPDYNVVVTGYTDSQGSQAYNQKLSEFRANIVGSFLLGKGIKPHQIKIKGLGSENPLETNETSQGRMMNRRVEIALVKPE